MALGRKYEVHLYNDGRASKITMFQALLTVDKFRCLKCLNALKLKKMLPF